MLIAEYGHRDSEWMPLSGRKYNGNSLWGYIVKTWTTIHPLLDFKLENGKMIHFCLDSWLPNGKLAISFHDLFSASIRKDIKIAYLYASSSDQNSWRILSRFSTTDSPRADLLRGLLSEVTIDPLIHDSLNLIGSPKLEVSHIYSSLKNINPSSFPWKELWKIKLPSRITLFAWEAIHGGILTQDKLKNKGFRLANRCVICESFEETINHLLLDCHMAKEIWSLIQNIINLQWEMPLIMGECWKK
ncbi:uncharacterized protein LOC124939472 [Impatiens glandulifera]|uniref:uncharacterized protein LOC124939472 n=1 Tax=Impatiens glandulifera TaxID=253017 RepID=UPI001FB06CFC|nr:uncharacterized protein LOC124939472 [Impatiens glandulifera]